MAEPTAPRISYTARRLARAPSLRDATMIAAGDEITPPTDQVRVTVSSRTTTVSMPVRSAAFAVRVTVLSSEPAIFSILAGPCLAVSPPAPANATAGTSINVSAVNVLIGLPFVSRDGHYGNRIRSLDHSAAPSAGAGARSPSSGSGLEPNLA